MGGCNRSGMTETCEELRISNEAKKNRETGILMQEQLKVDMSNKIMQTSKQI